MNSIPVITIDGPSGSGKGTVSWLLAKKLNWHFLDSGAIYRVLAYAALQKFVDADAVSDLTKLAAQLNFGFKAEPEQALPSIFYEDIDVTHKIREENVGLMASKIAIHLPVRDALLARQRDFRKLPGLVTDGRDMGTVVFPDAAHKFFLSASVEERALRRAKQLAAQGEEANYAEILADIRARDERDQNRAVSPLKPASDAVFVDTTGLSIEQVLAELLQCINSK